MKTARIPEDGGVLVVAAHPDDIKSVFGVVRAAQADGRRVTLVLATKGEGLRRQHLSLMSPRQIGAVRIKELRRFLKKAGIPPEDFLILGVPDGGPLTAMREDFYDRGPAYCDVVLMQVDAVPYADAVQPGMPLRGSALVDCLGSILAERQPRLVLTHHPQDDHPDHRALAWFVVKALRQLKRQRRIGSVQAWATLVYCHACAWPPPGDFFLTPEVAERFAHLPCHHYCLNDAAYADKMALATVFGGTEGEAYIRANIKHDEPLWRLL